MQRGSKVLRLAQVVVAIMLPMLVAAGPQPTSSPSTGPTGGIIRLVYFNDFEKSIDDAWRLKDGTKPPLSATPKGGRSFLGELNNDCATLILHDLPPHRCVRVTFDLFIIRSWDGEQVNEPSLPTACGPDVWELQVQGGPVLISSSFSNVNQAPPYTYLQSFPDWHGDGLYQPKTAAAEKDTLGFLHQYNAQGPIVSDAAYSFSLTFPHSAKDLSLLFKSQGLESIKLESWGLDNVKVEAITGPSTLGEKELAGAWQALDSSDPAEAFKGFWALASASPQARELTARDDGYAPSARVRKLIAELDDDAYRVRTNATKELKAMGPSIAPLLHNALKDSKSLEVQSRLQLILDGMGSAAEPSGRRRQVRLVHLRQVLGMSEDPVATQAATREAKAP